jgi:hypothetical protein
VSAYSMGIIYAYRTIERFCGTAGIAFQVMLTYTIIVIVVREIDRPSD